MDLSKYDSYLNSIFRNCTSLRYVNFGDSDFSKVTQFAWAFEGCTNLKTIDLSNFNTTNATTTEYMFGDCVNLETIYVSELFSVAKVTNSYTMFQNCPKLTGGAGTQYTSSKVDKTYARVDGKVYDSSVGWVDDPTVLGYFTLKQA